MRALNGLPSVTIMLHLLNNACLALCFICLCELLACKLLNVAEWHGEEKRRCVLLGTAAMRGGQQGCKRERDFKQFGGRL
jgi:hypothetical protein